MLPKAERLTKEDFIGKRPKVFFRGMLFDVAVLALATKKFACVTSKKTLKRSVDRNTIKRRIFNTLKEIDPQTENSFIFYPKKESITTPHSHLYKEIKKVFDTLH